MISFHFNIFVALLVALLSLQNVISASNKLYNIVPSPSQVCPEEPCITLSQFAANTDSYLGPNTTLSFLPGRHVLDSEFHITNIHSLTMTAVSNYTSPLLTNVTCAQEGKLLFVKVDFVELESLSFIGCEGSGIVKVGKFVFINSNFVGKEDNRSRTIMFDVSDSFVYMIRSNFTGHRNGQVMFFSHSSVEVNESTFAHNEGVVLHAYETILHIGRSQFYNNSVYGTNVGAAIYALNSRVSIIESNFSHNYAEEGSAAIHAVQYTKLSLNKCRFHKNVAGNMGGALSLFIRVMSNATDCIFSENSATGHGGALAVYQSTMVFERSLLVNNYAKNGGAIFAYKRSHLFATDTSIVNNTAAFGVVFMLNSIASFLKQTTYLNNLGSLLVFNGRVTFYGDTEFSNNNAPLANADTVNTTQFDEGGAVTAYQSDLVFYGTCKLTQNRARVGGAIRAIQSKLYVHVRLTVSNNTAAVDGGGADLSQSEVLCRNHSSIVFLGNSATEKGGGIHAVSSSVSIDFTVYDYNYVNSSHTNHYYTGSTLHFIENKASTGGGVYLEYQSKIYVLKKDVYHDLQHPIYSLTFSSNAAKYGGAVYVDDETNWSTCNSTAFKVHSTTAECFLQTLALHGRRYPSLNLINTKFEFNVATESGSTLFGGLLDRCTVNTFAEVRYKYDSDTDVGDNVDGLKYLLNTSNIQAIDSRTIISSYPVRLCFCEGRRPACGYQPPPLHIRKGQNFTLSVVVVDQLNNSISNSSVYSYLSSNQGLLTSDRQSLQNTHSGCSTLTFTAYSLCESEELVMYAEGPCRNADKSLLRQKINFLPCKCPVGFKRDFTDRKICKCKCDPQLRPYITECNETNEVLYRRGDFWINYVNASDSYVVYPHCPRQYCQPSTTTVEISFSSPNGTGAQCTADRSGVLCGACKPGLSLSLSSSKCVSCPNYWPALFAVIVIASLLAGLLLVAVVLVLNLTVAVGTLNGIFFFANIVNINKSLLFPFPVPNYITVFLSWLNLELGFDVCFIEGMDAYGKTWLQLAFPLYIILLVILVIVLGERSQRFAHLIGKKDPVATLATLILLSYDKLFHTTIEAFSFATLEYPGGRKERVWLLDANVKYLNGKHIPLFLCALIILTVCILYTGLLLTWQWLLRCPKNRLLRWTRNQKLHLFLKTYHAPYTIKHRYWPGFLLVVRTALSISSAFNMANDPTLSLIFLGFSMILLLFLVGRCSPVYENSLLELVEVTIYVNITMLFAFSLFALESGRNQTAIAYISGTVAILQFLVVIAHHVYLEFGLNKYTCTKEKKDNDELAPYPPPERKPTHTSLGRFCEDREFLTRNDGIIRRDDYMQTDSGINVDRVNENTPLISRSPESMHSESY